MKHLKMESYEKNDYLNSPFAAWIVDGFFLDYLFILEEQPHMFQSVFPSNAGQVMEFLLLTLLSMGEQKSLLRSNLTCFNQFSHQMPVKLWSFCS